MSSLSPENNRDENNAAQDRGQGAPTPDGVERGLERSSIHAPDNAAAYSSGHDYKLGRAPVDAQQTSTHPGLGIECLSPALPAPSAAKICPVCRNNPVTTEIEGRVLVCTECANDPEIREHAKKDWR